MKIAVISDIHGNLPALEAVLEHIKTQEVDQIYCAGDFIDPFRESTKVWEYLKNNDIPTVRGNHEDYIINCFNDTPAKTGWMKFNQKMIRQLAGHMGPSLAEEIAKVPFELEIQFPDGELMHMCHASFNCNYRSHVDEFTPAIREFVLSHPASLFISGHKHFHDKIFLEENLMVIVGSLGLPLDQDNRAQYITVTRNEGSWVVDPIRVAYDFRKTIKSFEENNWLINTGGIGLLMVDQLLTGENRLSPFIHWLQSQRSSKADDAPATHAEWLKECIAYLDKFDRLDELRKELSSESLASLGF